MLCGITVSNDVSKTIVWAMKISGCLVKRFIFKASGTIQKRIPLVT